jgi:hypothetical protein
MNSLIYYSSAHSSDLLKIKERINYYLENDSIVVLLNEFNHLVVNSSTIFSKQDIWAIDSAMSSLGYIRS